MLQMAHVLTLANEKNKHVLVFQDKLKDAYNCCVDVLHYKPGWDHPRKVTRRETRTLVAAGAVPIHLNDPPSSSAPSQTNGTWRTRVRLRTC